MEKSAELATLASDTRQRAASVGTAGISSDDPSAIGKLQERITKLEALQARMVAANTCVRRKDRAGLLALGLTEQQADELFQPDFCGRFGFPDYALTNNSANIRRLKARLAGLGTRSTETKETATAGGVRIVENADINRLQLFFPGKPSDGIRGNLKRSGFRWSPTEGAWQRQLNDGARWAAQHVLGGGQ